MIRNRLNTLMFAAAAACATLACESGGVGDPCIPEDEYQQDFTGFQEQEVNVESRSFQCETRVCIVNHFQGRVSCPYGQTEASIATNGPDHPERCRVPGTDGTTCVDPVNGNRTECLADNSNNVDQITVPVDPQKIFRSAEDTVYCSCRCAGPPEEKNARYCECPSGYVCEELVRDVGVDTGRGQLVGSYCIKPNTKYDPSRTQDPNVCNFAAANAGDTANEIGGQGRRRSVARICGVTEEGGTASNPPL